MPPTVPDLLGRAVLALGGAERPGQTEMAEAVAEAFDSGTHLLVQAGTGTGKSLAYLVPSLLHALTTNRPVIVATATLALQAQIVERDLPALVAAIGSALPRPPRYATLKGRSHYLCRRKLSGDGASDDEPVLLEAAPTTKLGREVARLRTWAASTDTGHRDDLRPGVSERAWGQVSVSARDCIGATRCPFGESCFAERARTVAESADVVVTNHALLAIDALEGIPVLPEHDAVVIDEAHDLVDRVTAAATRELSTPAVDQAVARAARLGDSLAAEAERLRQAGVAYEDALESLAPGRVVEVPAPLRRSLRLLADASREVQSGLIRLRGSGEDAAHKLAGSAVDALRAIAERCEAGSDQDVLWVADDERRGRSLQVAPLSVGGLLGGALFAGNRVVLTSATLQLGGSFDPVARSVGLPPAPDPSWRGLDVGSPFDYPRQGMLYVGAHLPPPGRDGASPAVLDELAELMLAAGGRTLGLFSSQRAAEAAAVQMRPRLPFPVLCQGEGSTGELIREFAAADRTCLFGTLSLWQGVDVPGSALHLVVVDRIPFPRPDDPLLAARAQQETAAGRNGFLGVFAAAAAVRLAQGVGRLIRSHADRGVVAILDSRVASARYGGFLLSTLPPFWLTRDPLQVRRSLSALDAAHPVTDEADSRAIALVPAVSVPPAEVKQDHEAEAPLGDPTLFESPDTVSSSASPAR